MINKFENENEKEKLFKQKRFLDRTLHENTGPNLCFSLHIKSLVWLYSFSYKNLSIFKAKLNKYFCPSFPENKIHSSTHHMHDSSKAKKVGQKATYSRATSRHFSAELRCPVCCCAVPKSHNDIGVLLMSVTKLVLT